MSLEAKKAVLRDMYEAMRQIIRDGLVTGAIGDWTTLAPTGLPEKGHENMGSLYTSVLLLRSELYVDNVRLLGVA